MSAEFSKEQLRDFINTAAAATYAGGGSHVENPERTGFYELVYEEPPFSYRDSYTGHYRSRGMEVVRHAGVPVWSSSYGGGMVDGKDDLSEQTFGFLKQAMSADEEGFDSFRGPSVLEDGDWRYTYQQEGNQEEFHGYEEIHYKGELVFYHRIIGGTIKHQK
jgi:hypothetical protein